MEKIKNKKGKGKACEIGHVWWWKGKMDIFVPSKCTSLYWFDGIINRSLNQISSKNKGNTDDLF